ncbi:hypothetical protein C0993_006924, partial [Termitomyces sp. T159_Od127]
NARERVADAGKVDLDRAQLPETVHEIAQALGAGFEGGEHEAVELGEVGEGDAGDAEM